MFTFYKLTCTGTLSDAEVHKNWDCGWASVLCVTVKDLQDSQARRGTPWLSVMASLGVLQLSSAWHWVRGRMWAVDPTVRCFPLGRFTVCLISVKWWGRVLAHCASLSILNSQVGCPFRMLTPVYECLSCCTNPPPAHSSNRCCFHGAGIVLCLARWQADFVRSSFSTVFSQLKLCQDDLCLASLGLPSYHDQAVFLFKSMLSSHKEINTFGSVGSLLSTASLAGNALLCLENSFFSLFPLSPLLIFKSFISVLISNLAISFAVSSLVSEMRIEEMCCILFFEVLFWPMKSSRAETVQIWRFQEGRGVPWTVLVFP